MFGFKKKEKPSSSGDPFKDYGLGDLREETARSSLEASYKLKTTTTAIDYMALIGKKELDGEFWNYVNEVSSYKRDAYIVKEIRKKTVECQTVDFYVMPKQAIAELSAMELSIICAGGENSHDPLNPTNSDAIAKIKKWRADAEAIVKEAAYIEEQERQKSEAMKLIYENSSEKKLVDAFHGHSKENKLHALQNSTPTDWHWLVEDTELELYEVDEFVWLFSQSNCELGTAVKYLERWSDAELWDDIRYGDDVKDFREFLFPVYKVLIQGINANRFLNTNGYFTKVEFDYIQSVVNHQQSEFTTRGPALFEIDPNILPDLRKIVLETS